MTPTTCHLTQRFIDVNLLDTMPVITGMSYTSTKVSSKSVVELAVIQSLAMYSLFLSPYLAFDEHQERRLKLVSARVAIHTFKVPVVRYSGITFLFVCLTELYRICGTRKLPLNLATKQVFIGCSQLSMESNYFSSYLQVESTSAGLHEF